MNINPELIETFKSEILEMVDKDFSLFHCNTVEQAIRCSEQKEFIDKLFSTVEK